MGAAPQAISVCPGLCAISETRPSDWKSRMEEPSGHGFVFSEPIYAFPNREQFEPLAMGPNYHASEESSGRKVFDPDAPGPNYFGPEASSDGK